MAHFPLFIDLTDKKCLVVGGGQVALRKVEALLKYQADIIVATTELCPGLQVFADQKKIEVHFLGENVESEKIEEEKEILKKLIAGSTLVVAATGNREVNHLTASLCQEQGILVNVIDCAKECSFVFPSTVVKGEISIGINTGTNSPGLSKAIRKRIERAIPDVYAQIGAQHGILRDYVKAHYKEEEVRKRILRDLMNTAMEKEEILTQEEVEEIMERNADKTVDGSGIKVGRGNME